jgi:hypothetical protein
MYDVQTEFVLVIVNSSLLTRPLPPEAIPLVRPNSRCFEIVKYK